MTGPAISIDVENITDADVVALLTMLDLVGDNKDVWLYKLSKERNQKINGAEVSRLGIPYTDIKFADFDDYSLRTNDLYDAIMQNGPDQVVFTKNWDLAIMLKSQMPAVFLYG